MATIYSISDGTTDVLFNASQPDNRVICRVIPKGKIIAAEYISYTEQSVQKDGVRLIAQSGYKMGQFAEDNGVPLGNITDGSNNHFATFDLLRIYLGSIGLFLEASGDGGSSSSNLFTSESGSVSLTKSYLNSTYPTYLAGSTVYLPNANLKYVKMDNSNIGDWDNQPYNPTA